MIDPIWRGRLAIGDVLIPLRAHDPVVALITRAHTARIAARARRAVVTRCEASWLTAAARSQGCRATRPPPRSPPPRPDGSRARASRHPARRTPHICRRTRKSARRKCPCRRLPWRRAEISSTSSSVARRLRMSSASRPTSAAACTSVSLWVRSPPSRKYNSISRCLTSADLPEASAQWISRWQSMVLGWRFTLSGR